MRKPIQLLCILTVLVPLNSCATTIHDATFCSPIPGNLGAVCDNFLSSNQEILSQKDWEALILKWQSAGLSVECTTSEAVGNFKSEIEKLCSVSKCDYETKKQIIEGLERMSKLGQNLDVR